MAKEKPSGPTKARVLLDCVFGKCNAVVELTPDEIVAGEESGFLDSTPEAVAYAESAQ